MATENESLRTIAVLVKVPSNWEDRLDMQQVIEREIREDRWYWNWPDPLADEVTFDVEIDGHTYGLRPGAARIVKEALRDAQMLDFMIKTSASIGQVCGAGHWVLHFWPTDETEKVVRAGTPKEAIDAAMAKDGA